MRALLLIMLLLMPLEPGLWIKPRPVKEPVVEATEPVSVGPVYAKVHPWQAATDADTGYCVLAPGHGWNGSLSYPMPGNTFIRGPRSEYRVAEEFIPSGNDAFDSLRTTKPARTVYFGGRHFLETDHHRGVDFDAPVGTPVHAAASGVVVWAGYNSFGWANTVAISHGGGWVTIYAHLADVAVRCGQSVGRGQVVGFSGQSGLATWPHLHFEVQNGDYSYDPENYLRK